jgi:hypothetical protein
MSAQGTVTYNQILNALDIAEIPGLDHKPDDEFYFGDFSVDGCECDVDCEVCHGELPEPDHEVNSALIEDFIAACISGDAMTARALVGRVFEDRSDAALAEKCLGRLL